MKKATRATFKSFVKKNRSELLIKCESHFNGMTDCVEQIKDEFTPAVDVGMGYSHPDGEEYDRTSKNNLGIQGVYLVLGGRDYIDRFETDTLIGLSVYNCCGSFSVAIKK